MENSADAYSYFSYIYLGFKLGCMTGDCDTMAQPPTSR